MNKAKAIWELQQIDVDALRIEVDNLIECTEAVKEAQIAEQNAKQIVLHTCVDFKLYHCLTINVSKLKRHLYRF